MMKVQLIQLRVADGENLSGRLDRVLMLLDQSDAGLVMLPELWQTGFFHFDQYEAGADKTPKALAVLREKAAARKCWIHAGSFLERAGGAIFNTSLLLNPCGEIAARYQKVHLFGLNAQEKQLLTPGRQAVSAATPFGRLGLAACYDLRFPEQFRKMGEQGAAGFLVAACWPAERLSHWRLFCQARAAENQAFLLGCNCAGAHGGVQAAGHSLVVGPDGRILAEGGEGEEVLTAMLDPGEPEEYRKAFPVLADRTKF